MSDETGPPAPVVDVWWARTGRQEAGGLEALLDPAERGRLEALRQPADKERFVLAAALVRAAVATRLGVPVDTVGLDRSCGKCGKPHGKPRLVAPAAGLELSITHSGGVVGVAVADCGIPVGLDVEAVQRLRDFATLERAVLADTERAALDRAAGTAGPQERGRAFLQLWTRKEALTKMVGLGITVPLRQVVVSGPDEPARCLSWPESHAAPTDVALHDLRPPASGHVAALAVAHRAAIPAVRDGWEVLTAEL